MSALAPILTGIFQSASQFQQAQADYRAALHSQIMQQTHQKEMAEYAYQKDLEQWHRQNAYNTPSMQMSRFKDAGLNPHLIYGQGSPGNAAGTVNYRPPNLEWKLGAPQIGPAIQAVLPTLMEVGSWMQQMRLSEVEIEKRKSESTRAGDLVQFLRARYPKDLAKLDNALSLFPHQRDVLSSQSELMSSKVSEILAELQHKFGPYPFDFKAGFASGGIRREQALQEIMKRKLLEARSSFTEYGVTDPQRLMEFVLKATGDLVGSMMKLSTFRRRP